MSARRWETLEQRRAAHLERLARWQALSPKEQLAALDAQGLSARKQRQRLAAKLSA